MRWPVEHVRREYDPHSKAGGGFVGDDVGSWSKSNKENGTGSTSGVLTAEKNCPALLLNSGHTPQCPAVSEWAGLACLCMLSRPDFMSTRRDTQPIDHRGKVPKWGKARSRRGCTATILEPDLTSETKAGSAEAREAGYICVS
jgi:hypothetical protein